MRMILVAIALVVLPISARASTVMVDLSQLTPAGTIFGPCYCGNGPFYSISANPGDTLELGQLELFWQLGAAGPSTGTPNQVGYPQILYEMGNPVVSFNSPSTPPDATSAHNFAFCDPDTPSCAPAPVTYTLTYTLPAGDTSIQIGWYGQAEYTAPALAGAVPEPSTWAMLLIGFAAIGIVSSWAEGRDRKPCASSAAAPASRVAARG
jgi:hypothetical protein